MVLLIRKRLIAARAVGDAAKKTELTLAGSFDREVFSQGIAQEPRSGSQLLVAVLSFKHTGEAKGWERELAKAGYEIPNAKREAPGENAKGRSLRRTARPLVRP